ncbi:GNAT family N-acetyltransferase [Flavobacteriales bacterium]|nr:GNAT family N-acetyltransferase [Flavobacteriales bacterium]
MDYQFRKAELTDLQIIWRILKEAIIRRKEDGSNQWQDGYPNEEVIKNDLHNNYGYVLTSNRNIVGYCALIKNNEPEYLKIQGKWLSENDFIVFHRLAISGEFLNKGLAKKMVLLIENHAASIQIHSIKADTNHDNIPMIKLFKTLGYSYCGIVHFRKSPRNAFEKIINKLP